jgi:hypothetical protein
VAGDEFGDDVTCDDGCIRPGRQKVHLPCTGAGVTCAVTDGHAHAICRVDRSRDVNTHADFNGNGNANRNADSDSDTYAYSDTDTNADSDAYSDTNADAHAYSDTNAYACPQDQRTSNE